MRHEISIMDHSFMANLRVEPTCKLTVSHSWLSKGQQASHCSEVVFHIRHGEHSQCASQAMTGEVNLRIAMQCLQSLDLRQHRSFDCVVARLEAVVDFAVSASGIRHLVEGQINDPVLYVAAASEGKDDGVEIGRISGKALNISSRVRESLRILKDILTTFSAVPSVDAGHTLIGNRREVAQLKGQSRSVGQLRRNKQAHQHQCQHCLHNQSIIYNQMGQYSYITFLKGKSKVCYLRLYSWYFQQMRASLPQKEYYEQLKSQLLDPRQYPSINRIMNLPAFIKENEALFVKLSTELVELKNNQRKAERNVKIKTTPFYINASMQGRDEERVREIRARNELLQSNIAALRAEEERKRKQELPVLKEKKEELRVKQAEREKLLQLGRQLKKAMENEDMLELYQSKCRQCEGLRTVNNSISEEIKAVIKQINQVTGADQNPNMFFMNLKV